MVMARVRPRTRAAVEEIVRRVAARLNVALRATADDIVVSRDLLHDRVRFEAWNPLRVIYLDALEVDPSVHCDEELEALIAAKLSGVDDSHGKDTIEHILEAIRDAERLGAHRREMVILAGMVAGSKIEAAMAARFPVRYRGPQVPSHGQLARDYPLLYKEMGADALTWWRGEIHGVPLLKEPNMPLDHWRVQRLPSIAHASASREVAEHLALFKDVPREKGPDLLSAAKPTPPRPAPIGDAEWQWDGRAWTLLAATGACVAAAPTEHRCQLCGEPAEQFEMFGAKITSCPCVEKLGLGQMVAINVKGAYEGPMTTDPKMFDALCIEQMESAMKLADGVPPGVEYTPPSPEQRAAWSRRLAALQTEARERERCIVTIDPECVG